MTIGTINVNSFKKLFGENGTQHKKFEIEIKKIINEKLISLNVTKIDLYNLNEEKQSYRAGEGNQRLIIFGNATMVDTGDAIDLTVPKRINGIDNDFKHFLPPSNNGNNTLIMSEEGVALAEWSKGTYELNILFDLFKKFTPEAVAIFDFIMTEFERLVWYPKTLECSWKHTTNKDNLVKQFTEMSRRQREQQLNDDKRKIEQWVNEIDQARRKIKQYSDNLYQKRRWVESEEENIKNVSLGLVKDLDLILNHDKIVDLQIKDGKFIVYTKPLYIYSDKGNKYYGGSYRIELNPENSDVAFFGDNPRKSYWTQQDPHPHVNGNNGHACLGNVSSTIAELCSQMQIYALTMVCIDFLEAANTSDSAGKNVVNWDRVDDDGNIINIEDDPNYVVCPICGGRYCVEDMVTAYRTIRYEECSGDCDGNCDECTDREYTLGEEIRVCQNCINDRFYYDEQAQEYVRD